MHLRRRLAFGFGLRLFGEPVAGIHPELGFDVRVIGCRGNEPRMLLVTLQPRLVALVEREELAWG